MVRGFAALLALAGAQAYVLAAGELPRLSPDETALLVAGATGALVTAVCAALVAPVSDERALLWLIALGGGMVVATLNAAGAGAAASPVEALTYSAAGAAFACSFLTPSLALALPLFVALVDGGSALLGDPGSLLGDARRFEAGDPLSLELPDWGSGLPAGHVSVAAVVFVGVFLVYARRFELRPGATAIALAVALAASRVLEIELDTAIPALPLMAIAYFLVNADRLPGLFARTAEG